ncbi:MAG: hypothetical protein PHG20_04755, partial [Geobacteraceae bacterium]|nr:hypothetical protein [Geobacteraceae bacterium]
LQPFHERLEGGGRYNVCAGLVMIENCHGFAFGLINDSGGVLLRSLMLTEARAKIRSIKSPLMRLNYGYKYRSHVMTLHE